MAAPSREAVDTFMSITGVSEDVAVQKLEEHLGDLNAAVNAHFNEGDRRILPEASTAAPENDAMEIDEPIQVGSRGPPFSLLPSARNLSPFSILDPEFGRSLFDSGPGSRSPFVSHPREVREIPIEVKDGSERSGHSGLAPTIEDVTGTEHAVGPETHGTVVIDENDEDSPAAPSGHIGLSNEQKDDVLGGNSHDHRASAPQIDNSPDYSNDIEEEMVRAAIEASKREAIKDYPNQQFDVHDDVSNPGTQQRQTHLEDDELAHAVSLSLKTAEQEKALREQGENIGALEWEASKSVELQNMGKMISSNGRHTSRRSRLDIGSSSVQGEAEDVEEQPLLRHRSGRMSSASINPDQEIGEIDVTPPLSAGQRSSIDHPPHNGNDFQSDEWGGISSEEHDEAIMLEAALFGGIPEGSRYHFPHGPHQLMHNDLDRTSDLYPQRVPRPPSPGLAAQRLIREQQDDEYLASLQADREKELKAIQEAEAALEEERQKEEEARRKLQEEQEIERQLAAKESSLPHEPTIDDENAVNLLVRMPDGSRHGRRFLRSDKLQFLFDFIDVGRAVKPGTYRLVRPYPRRAFSDGEGSSTLNEVGLTSKQEALFLELI
ncbi:plant UBX domain-containing protein 8-like isoform X2 [Diospyros lotus]|uniref:plant UBX domain-containing protein 8-like isoform X2 n=1 Tax=Diospyros lotus TaxID=55363 RepID=UPI0022576BEC|nr:plant UBX domain-containing protein 8-like isoform X2 [Diospyros lotus]